MRAITINYGHSAWDIKYSFDIRGCGIAFISRETTLDSNGEDSYDGLVSNERGSAGGGAKGRVEGSELWAP